jgi:hypothetical protein
VAIEIAEFFGHGDLFLVQPAALFCFKPFCIAMLGDDWVMVRPDF